PVAILSPSGPIGHCGTGWSEPLNVTVTTGIAGSNTYTWFPAISTGPSGSATAFGDYYVNVSNSVSGCNSNTNIVHIYDNCTPGGGPGNPGPGCPPPPNITFTATILCDQIQIMPSLSSPAGIWSATTGSSPYITGLTTDTNGVAHATATAAGMFTLIYTVTYAPGCSKG